MLRHPHFLLNVVAAFNISASDEARHIPLLYSNTSWLVIDTLYNYIGLSRLSQNPLTD